MMARSIAMASLFGASLVVGDCSVQDFPHACACDGQEITIVGYDAAGAADDDYSDCFQGYGDLEWAKAKCDSEPDCTVLHDWHDDNGNWRACRSFTEGTGSIVLTKHDTPYHADWGKVAVQDGVLYMCDTIGCHSYTDGEWNLLDSLPAGVTLQDVGSTVSSATHTLTSYNHKVTLRSKSCDTGDGGPDAMEVGGDSASFGGPDGDPEPEPLLGDETAEPTASPTGSPTKAPTGSPTQAPTDYTSAMQQLQDARCVSDHGSNIVLRWDLGNPDQRTKEWRCYRKSELNWDIQGECMDNCGGKVACTGGITPNGASASHFSAQGPINTVLNNNIGSQGCDKGQYTMNLTPTTYGVQVSASTCDSATNINFKVVSLPISDPLSSSCSSRYNLGQLAVVKYHSSCSSVSLDHTYYCPPGMTLSGSTCYSTAAGSTSCSWHGQGKCDARFYYFPDGQRWPSTNWKAPTGGIKDSGGSTVRYESGAYRTNPVSRTYAGLHGCGESIRTLSCSNNNYNIINLAYDLGNDACI